MRLWRPEVVVVVRWHNFELIVTMVVTVIGVMDTKKYVSTNGNFVVEWWHDSRKTLKWFYGSCNGIMAVIDAVSTVSTVYDLIVQAGSFRNGMYGQKAMDKVVFRGQNALDKIVFGGQNAMKRLCLEAKRR